MRIDSTFGVLWAMAFCWLGSAGLTNAGIFNVRSAPYNAKGDGVTDDVRAIQSAIEAAAQAGPGNTVLLPAGNYYLLSPGVDRGFYFRIPPSAVNLTIAGEGTNTFLLSAWGHSPFIADRCTNCKIQNLTVDFKTLNVTQGKITAVDAGQRTATVSMDSGYAAPNSATFTAGGRYRPQLRVLSSGRNTFNWSQQLTITSITQTNSQWVIGLNQPVKADDVGKRFFIWGKQQGEWTRFVDCRDCSGFSVQNVADYAGGGFSGGGSSGTLNFSNFYCGPPPGSDRLGFYGGHQGHTRANVVLTDCQWLMSNDDDMNELTPLQDILAHPSPNIIQVAHGSDYQAGDTVSTWDYTDVNSVHVRTNAVVKSVAHNANGNDDLVLDKDVEIVRTGKGTGQPNQDPNDRVVNLTSGGTWKLINCAFSSSFAHPLLLKTARGIDMEGCRIFGSDMSGLDCGMQTYWNEGPQTCNVTLKHNTFYDIDGISCRIGIEVPDGTSSGSRDQQNIDIEENLFLSGGNHDVWNGIMPRGVALLIGNVHGAVVKNNVFAGFPNASIVVYSSDNVAISDNVFLNAHSSSNRSQNWPRSANVDPGSLITVNHSSHVLLGGNLLYNDGPFGSKLVAVGPDVSGMEGADTGVVRAKPLLCQAANAVIHNARLNPAAEAGGASYVVGITQPDSYVKFTATVPSPGRYPVIVTFDNAGTDSTGYGLAATQQIIVNGDDGSPVTVTYPFTGSWGRFNPGYVTISWVNLKAGANTLQFNHATNSADLRGIVIPVKS